MLLREMIGYEKLKLYYITYVCYCITRERTVINGKSCNLKEISKYIYIVGFLHVYSVLHEF